MATLVRKRRKTARKWDSKRPISPGKAALQYASRKPLGMLGQAAKDNRRAE